MDKTTGFQFGSLTEVGVINSANDAVIKQIKEKIRLIIPENNFSYLKKSNSVMSSNKTIIIHTFADFMENILSELPENRYNIENVILILDKFIEVYQKITIKSDLLLI